MAVTIGFWNCHYSRYRISQFTRPLVYTVPLLDKYFRFILETCSTDSSDESLFVFIYCVLRPICICFRGSEASFSVAMNNKKCIVGYSYKNSGLNIYYKKNKKDFRCTFIITNLLFEGHTFFVFKNCLYFYIFTVTQRRVFFF